MAIVENPCADGHPELALLLDVTPFAQRYPTMHCRRCGENLTYEEAIRNDERLKTNVRVAELVRQRDAVLALCDEAEQDEPTAVFSQGGPMWTVWTAEIRKIYGGGE